MSVGELALPLTPGAKERAREAKATAAALPNNNTDKSEEEEDVALSRLYAFGSTFVLAPSFSVRLGQEDCLLLRTEFAAREGPAMLLLSELQPRMPTGQFELDIAPRLSKDATRLLTEANAGGSSRISEAMSLEMLHRSFGAKLGKTEMELLYWPANGAITDFSIVLDGITLGVSVTRALQPPGAPPYSEVEAECLLRKKLSGVIKSTETCCNADWTKQILHVWAASRRVANKLHRAFERLEPELISNTLVLVTLCKGMPELFMERSRIERQRQRVLKGLKSEAHLAVLRESDPCATRKPAAAV